MLIHDFFTESIIHDEQPIDEGIHDPNIFKAIFMAGPPGAGKNVVIEQMQLSDIYTGLKLQDIDHTIAYLNKRKAPENPDYQRGLNKTLQRQQVFQKGMLGLLINTTGRDYDSLMGIDKQLKQAGYDTFMIFVDAKYNVALDRIKHREKYSTDPADKNRKVDMPYFVDAYDNSTKNQSFYALMFGNQYALITNNVLKAQKELTEDDEILIDPAEAAEAAEAFRDTMKEASKKVRRFLRKPLTPVAQQIVTQATPPAVARAA